jgi:hypothetical protein
MTLEEIRKRVQQIEDVVWDNEKAHGLEDDLYLDFIRFVEKMTTDDTIGNLAAEVLKAADVEFSRWTA